MGRGLRCLTLKSWWLSSATTHKQWEERLQIAIILEQHSESAAGPRYICLDFESPRNPHLPPQEIPALALPGRQLDRTLSSLLLEVGGKWDASSMPLPLPRLQGKPLSISIWNADGGGPDGKIIRGGGFYPHPADPQKSLFLTRTVFITIA